MSKHRWLYSAFLLVLLPASAQEIQWSTQFSSGTSEGGGVRLEAVTGQTLSGQSQGGSINLSSGYFPTPPNSDFIFSDSYE